MKAPALLGLLIILMLTGVTLVHAQTGGGYDLSWSTVDGGGGTFSTGSGYSLGGTAGQPDAGLLSGGDYTLSAGYWHGIGPAARYTIYLPLIVARYVHWVAALVDPAGGSPSLALDAAGRPHISYSANGGLMYAWRAGP